MTELSPESEAQAMLERIEAQATRHATPCGDGTMTWRVWGKGPPLVLLHGSHGSWQHWVRNIEALARHRTLWVADLPGMGASAMPHGTGHADIADPIAAGIRTLQRAAGPVDLAGFSFGGVVATHLALRHPDIVRRLVIIGPGGLDTPLGDFAIRRLRGLDPVERDEALRENMMAIMLSGPAHATPLAMHIYLKGGADARFPVEPLIMPDHIVRVLSDVRAPLDAIWGEFDRPHPHPAEQEAALRRFKPDLRFRVIRDAGHWCMFEQPDAFNAALLDLLETMP